MNARRTHAVARTALILSLSALAATLYADQHVPSSPDTKLELATHVRAFGKQTLVPSDVPSRLATSGRMVPASSPLRWIGGSFSRSSPSV